MRHDDVYRAFDHILTALDAIDAAACEIDPSDPEHPRLVARLLSRLDELAVATRFGLSYFPPLQPPPPGAHSAVYDTNERGRAVGAELAERIATLRDDLAGPEAA